MAKLRIKYIAIDPYYSDQEHVFIGLNIEDCWEMEIDFEKYLGREHANGINSIYKIEILEENYE